MAGPEAGLRWLLRWAHSLRQQTEEVKVKRPPRTPPPDAALLMNILTSVPPPPHPVFLSKQREQWWSQPAHLHTCIRACEYPPRSFRTTAVVLRGRCCDGVLCVELRPQGRMMRVGVRSVRAVSRSAVVLVLRTLSFLS